MKKKQGEGRNYEEIDGKCTMRKRNPTKSVESREKRPVDRGEREKKGKMREDINKKEETGSNKSGEPLKIQYFAKIKG